MTSIESGWYTLAMLGFPTRAEYALRAMAYLATLATLGDDCAPAQRISEETGVPAPYLSKVLRRLTVAGLLLARKGHGGGFSLAYEPADITFTEILAAVDVDVDDEDCAFGWKSCDPRHPCPLHPARASLKESLLLWANDTTLADLLSEWVPAKKRRRRAP